MVSQLQRKYDLHILTQKTFIISMKERRAFVKEDEKANATNANDKNKQTKFYVTTTAH